MTTATRHFPLPDCNRIMNGNVTYYSDAGYACRLAMYLQAQEEISEGWTYSVHTIGELHFVEVRDESGAIVGAL